MVSFLSVSETLSGYLGAMTEEMVRYIVYETCAETYRTALQKCKRMTQGELE